jgi:hypothetical protein
MSLTYLFSSFQWETGSARVDMPEPACRGRAAQAGRRRRMRLAAALPPARPLPGDGAIHPAARTKRTAAEARRGAALRPTRLPVVDHADAEGHREDHEDDKRDQIGHRFPSRDGRCGAVPTPGAYDEEPGPQTLLLYRRIELNRSINSGLRANTVPSLGDLAGHGREAGLPRLARHAGAK